MSIFFALASGVVFGIGLLLSGMTEPLKVRAFLDLIGPWNPSLALVMGGAIAIGCVGFRLAAQRKLSWSGDPMQLPPPGPIDRRLVAGGMLFGAGWGIAGYCPGPALVAVGSGSTSALLFVAAMLAGIVLYDQLWATSKRVASQAPMRADA